MTTMTAAQTPTAAASGRAAQLADRLEQGARQLAELASSLTDAEWGMPLPGDGRTIGVVVHHVASVYPIEIQLAQALAKGEPVGATMADVHTMNAAHAAQEARVGKADALALLARNSAAAAAAIRRLTDQELANAAPTSLYEGAPVLTCQFLLEDHPVRHSYHHAARIRRALGR